MGLDEPISTAMSYTNYVTYQDPRSGRDHVGHYDLDAKTVQPLSFISGTPIDSLYQVIEVGESNIIISDETLSASSIKILPPLADRDVLCVGKNYAEHAKEFNSSGFDSSDKADQPSHPVIFTKRFTSIIADGEDIYPHSAFTQTADYEGEIGVIIGRAGFRISEENSMSHVWGYTIINDVTARERQRDHKQFYLGKSPDTFCPMGPVAVPASRLDKVLRVQTHVNGELRQNATTEDLIFSIPNLIKTMSEGQTLMPGDVLATGTPVGVGIGKSPPVYLKPDDVVAVSVTGLGTLTNRIARPDSRNPITEKVCNFSHVRQNNATKTVDTESLATINNKHIHYKNIGNNTGSPVLFVHGLGGSNEMFNPLIQSLSLHQSHALHCYDFEGHGLSPTSPLSKLSIESLAEDLNGVFEHASIASGAVLVAHSMGCLIAVQFALLHPGKVSKLILLSPPSSALHEVDRQALCAQAKAARTKGMSAVVDDITAHSVSEQTESSNPLAVAAIRISLLGQNPEGYAKACTALAEAKPLDLTSLEMETWFITGSDDKVSSPELCQKYSTETKRSNLRVLTEVGHWHIFEDLAAVTKAVKEALE
ncbi:fumarylacetoacetate hydrolase-like protein [Ophiobolus disseminans]|uniref:Fumarylacetoacetate hydrolase-like protein n=1 Tax=Ophiobolus disseminans TaxID=1469910 RepID=A0A6A7AHT7_9PLEO|nr:fumarylacetoacetate hydrolase-like protein [Ophiobolus disseminans]